MASTNPTTTTTTPLNPNPTTTNRRQTYWCHECDMSFSLLIYSPSHLICPHCNGDFCEEMDSPLFSPSQNPNFSSLPPPLHPISSPPQSLTPNTDPDEDLDFDSFQLPSTIRISDAYLLDRLIQHLTDR
ncbi:RING-type E3 ubiquitin transferase [Ranunculus cassubicifolius]